MELIVRILAYGAQWGIETVFLMLALWGMVRIQKLHYNFGDLAVSAAITCGLDLIPFVGHYVALAVLWACLAKITREGFAGVVFTAAISYALVFSMNLFLLGALIGDLRVSARERSLPSPCVEAEADSKDESDNALVLDSEDHNPSGSRAAPSPTVLAQVPAKTQIPKVPVKPASVQAKPVTAPGPPAHPAATSRLAKRFTLKAATLNGSNSTAVIFTGVNSYGIGLGQTIFIATEEGAKKARLEKVDSQSAVLDLDGEKVDVPKALAP